MKHYYIEGLDQKGYSIQFDQLSHVDMDRGGREILAVIEIPKPSEGERYFGVKIPLNELKEAVKWLDEKAPSPENA